MAPGDGDSSLPPERPVEPIRVFVSYRRTDDANFTGRFYDRLVSAFGPDHVVRDIDSIPAGARFADVIAQHLATVDVVVAMIGPTWAAGDRLYDVSDLVRIEIASALATGKPVVPVLIQETMLPAPNSLPDDLKALLELNAVRVRRDPDFHKDVGRVLDGIVRSASSYRERVAKESRRAREADELRRDVEAGSHTDDLEERRVAAGGGTFAPSSDSGSAGAEDRSGTATRSGHRRSIRVAVLCIAGALLSALVLVLLTRQPDRETDIDRSSTTRTGAVTTSASASAGPSPLTTNALPTSSTTPAVAPSGDPAMSLTIDLNPAAVWDDGTPITIADFQCTMSAALNTPGSVTTVGYDKILSIEPGASEKQVVIAFSEVYAPYKNLFRTLIKADAVEDCNDVSAVMVDDIPFSGREWKIDSWSPDELILIPNESYWGPEQPMAERVVIVPMVDSDAEIAALKAGESDFIFPQAYDGITDALTDPNVDFIPGYGTNYEGLFFQQREGVFADDDFRMAFAKSIDRELILRQIYDPIFPGGALLNCGMWVPTLGDWCDNSVFADFYDPAGAEQILKEAGWTRGREGYWTNPEGDIPEIRWIVNTGNPLRESTQALMIPELAAAGFNIVTHNCDSACYFQERLPALDYDLAMYIETASPDPSVTSSMHCASVPTEENGNRGSNFTGWCNEDASALMTTSDQTIDDAARLDLIHQIAQDLADDAVMLPLYQFPNIAAWRADTVSGPIDRDAANFMAFQNIWEWVPASGDQIVIGAEQWPDCLNPITVCANSSWYLWTTAFKVLPAVWNTTNTGTYEPSALVVGEPTVELHG